MQRRQRKIVPGVRISRVAASRSAGTVRASSASHARSGHVKRMSARPLALSHSELMTQHKDLGVLPPPLPPRRAQQRHGTGDNQEDQPRAHQPKIIPPPGRPRPAWHMPDVRPSGQRSAVSGQRKHPAHGTGFRHLQSSGGAVSVCGPVESLERDQAVHPDAGMSPSRPAVTSTPRPATRVRGCAVSALPRIHGHHPGRRRPG